MHKTHLCLTAIFLSLALAACAGTGPKASSSASMFVGQTSDSRYQRLWSAAERVTARYFKIQKEDRLKGIITSEPRVDRDPKGTETKRAFVTIFKIPSGYDVKVEIPYLHYDRYENVYSEETKDGKRMLVVEKKRIEPPAKTDIYLESLVKAEILHEGVQTAGK